MVKLGNSGDRIPVYKEKYQCLVGKLIYLSHTRPDILYVVSTVNQFMQAPCEDYIEAVNKIMRYLKLTPDKGLGSGRQTKGVLRPILILTGQSLF